MALSSGTMSVIFSTNRNGARCGSKLRIASTSRMMGASVMTFLLLSLQSHFEGVHFAHPFSYRFCRHSAIIHAALIAAVRGNTRPARKARAVTDPGMVPHAGLPRQDDKIPDFGAARDAGQGDDETM